MDTEAIVFNAIYSRRSVRWFDDNKDVEDEKLLKLLKAAMAAPSACNIQPWEFIIVKNKDMIEKIKIITDNNGNYNANRILVICGNNTHIPWKDYGIIDCAAAMENMMIAAPALGLGTVVVGGFQKDKVKEYLSIPDEVEPICLLYIGYPKEEKKPRTKFIESAIHWEKYDNTFINEPRPGNILVFGPNASL